MVKALLAGGANINQANKVGTPQLSHACYSTPRTDFDNESLCTIYAIIIFVNINLAHNQKLAEIPDFHVHIQYSYIYTPHVYA